MKLGVTLTAALLAYSLALLAACESCHPVGTIVAPTPGPDAGPVWDDCARACALRADAGCGAQANCPSACAADQALGAASQLNVGCVLEAGANRAALAACGACNLGGSP